MVRRIASALHRFAPLEPGLFVLWAAVATIGCARNFYGFMLKQTGGEWSAPLDDVFIHFDYARSTAQGYPFQWTAGNGYSSGNTSILYPFVLALGHALGWQDEQLMVWAAVVAAVCVFGMLLALRGLLLRRARDTWGRVASYLLPPIMLGVGALNWSLWSGMEVALFMGLWSLVFVLHQHHAEVAPVGAGAKVAMRRAWLLGAAGMLLVATRPEAVTTMGAFGLFAALRAPASRGRRLRTFAAVVAPGIAFTILQAAVNRALTGESSANGAIVKLALNNPYMTPDEKWADWVFNLRYAIMRNIEYHFADNAGEITRFLDRSKSPVHEILFRFSHGAGWGLVLVALGLLPLAFRRSRPVALMLWAQIVGWMLVVALNGQVRWQNERYTMPAVAWLLMLVALGFAQALRRHERPNVPWLIFIGALLVQGFGAATRPLGMQPQFRYPWLPCILGGAIFAAVLFHRKVRGVLAVMALLLAYDHQVAKMRDQRWFFGRASRNIRDQHTTMGRWLKQQKPQRVLVGDAGAIIYASEAKGLDIIGLGGFRDLPFARAGVQGLPATLELLERVPAQDRPDILAIFPTWWGIFPTWFGAGELRRFPVEGNVICGGYEHVAYRADFHLLGSGARLRLMPEGDQHVRDEVDVADLVSEKQHGYVFPHPAGGWTDMRILADPKDPVHDMFDAGRRISPGRAETFTLRNAQSGKAGHLVLRTAPEAPGSVLVLVGGKPAGTVTVPRFEGWLETAVEIPAELMSDRMEMELRAAGPADFVNFHVWLTQ